MKDVDGGGDGHQVSKVGIQGSVEDEADDEEEDSDARTVSVCNLKARGGKGKSRANSDGQGQGMQAIGHSTSRKGKYMKSLGVKRGASAFHCLEATSAQGFFENAGWTGVHSLMNGSTSRRHPNARHQRRLRRQSLRLAHSAAPPPPQAAGTGTRTGTDPHLVNTRPQTIEAVLVGSSVEVAVREDMGPAVAVLLLSGCWVRPQALQLAAKD